MQTNMNCSNLISYCGDTSYLLSKGTLYSYEGNIVEDWPVGDEYIIATDVFEYCRSDTQIYYSKWSNDGLYVANLDGSAERQVLTNAIGNIIVYNDVLYGTEYGTGYFAKYVENDSDYTVIYEEPSGNFTPSNGSIYWCTKSAILKYDIDTEQITEIYPADEAIEGFFIIDKWIYVSEYQTIYQVNLDGTDIKLFADSTDGVTGDIFEACNGNLIVGKRDYSYGRFYSTLYDITAGTSRDYDAYWAVPCVIGKTVYYLDVWSAIPVYCIDTDTGRGYTRPSMYDVFN